MAVVLLVVGLVVLTLGADILVRGASALASAVGLPSLVIGLTVVAFGTSAPEMAVSVSASLDGNGDIAVGNVVGSNIFNVLLILGASALITPLVASKQLVRLDVPVMVLASALAWRLAADHSISRIEGSALFLGLIVYTTALVLIGRSQSARARTPEHDGASIATVYPGHFALSIVMVVAGLGLLVLGSKCFVDGAATLARSLGVSDLLIGLTIVAAGTSLPEVATSIMASIKGQRDIAIGNVVGSNIFNVLGVLGASAMSAAHGVSVSAPALSFDIPVMCAVALACLPIFLTGGRISRVEGWVLLASYALYVALIAM